jgi:hypothetical protein
MLERQARTRGPAVAARREPTRLRRRLTVGPADDPFEREADAVAATVVANLRAPATMSGAPDLQRSAAAGAGRAGVVGAAGGAVPDATAGRIRPSGDRFDGVTRGRMEDAFGADFSAVRVHTGASVDIAAEGLQADAFTLGRDVYVRRALYEPGTPAGDRLLAHELTHTLQQGGATLRRSPTAGVAVHGGMPADRVSRKKTLMYLDFVKMKRYDPKYGVAIQEQLGMDVEEDDDDTSGSFGHWWTEVGTRNPDTGAFTHQDSYGWWPSRPVAGVGELLMGVPGSLNKGRAQDPHAGETGKAGLSEFHPAMEVDTAAETYDQIRARVTGSIRTFATGYTGKWHWKLGWGKNCHTFQQSMKTKTKLHYKSAKSMLEDPTLRAKIASDKQAATENLAAVSGREWFTCDNDSLGTMQRDGEEGQDLRLGPTKDFSVTGKKMTIIGVHCQEVVTRAGARGWVTEMELRTYTSMARRS